MLDLGGQRSSERLGAGAWVAHLDGKRLELPEHLGAEVGCSSDPSATVLFEGVLHDRADLGRALGLPRSELPSDSELVLQAYRRFGSGMLDRLRGVFALLVWDAERSTLLCARDQLGLHPLFYADRGGELYVSSSIHALLAHESVPSLVNRAALADHLAHRWPDPGETYFTSIRRVPPGHTLRWAAGRPRLDRYWDPVPPGEEPEWVRAEDLGRFDELLAQAVRRAVSLGPPAVFLSGGLDSVSVAAFAADEARARGDDPPLALSLDFPDPTCNEVPVQRGVASALGMEQVMVGFVDALPEPGLIASALALSRERPAPVISYWTPAYMTLGVEGRNRGRQVILTGHGGDEWLTVTPVYAADRWRSLDLGGLLWLSACERRSFPVSPWNLWKNLVWKFGLKPLLTTASAGVLDRAAPSALRAYRRLGARKTTPEWVAPDPAVMNELVSRGETRPPRRDRSHYLNELRMALDHPLVSLEMEEVFENGRSLGMPVMTPLLDPDLVDFLYRTPPRLLDHGGRAKGLVRTRLARRFPELGFERQKKVAATSYSRTVMQREVAAEWNRSGGIPALAELGVASSQHIGPVLARAGEGDYLSQFRVWDALNLESWLRSHL